MINLALTGWTVTLTIMPPKALFDAPRAPQQFIVCGIERGKMFADNEGRYSFIKRLDRIIKKPIQDATIVGNGKAADTV